MLHLDLERRAKVSEMVDHDWIDGIIVQGGIDVVRKREQEEEARGKVTEEAKGRG